jgi:hypothetical protein
MSVVLRAQFPGPAGTAGSTAMPKDSGIFVAWAKLCNVTRGYQDISNPSLGYANVGDSSYAIGKSDGGIVSLGDGGSAVVTFTTPISNGPGYDFAVFENAFNNTFLELAFVEVSSDGINYFRFPATSNLPTSPQYTNDAAMDATKINNLAGKYRSLYGTPFDLQELVGIAQLDLNNITHVKVIDVVGSITVPYSTFDKNNNVINDPWPTAFGSCGFDLDAIGVINTAVGIEELNKQMKMSIFPNPATDQIAVRSSEFVEGTQLRIINMLSQEVFKENLKNAYQLCDISKLEAGIYLVQIQNKKGSYTTRLVKN